MKIIRTILSLPFIILVFIWYSILIVSNYLTFLISDWKIIADLETKKLNKLLKIYANN